MDDPYQLKRFIDAQAYVYDEVLEELSRGRKTSHWMWFIFPQIDGLGSSHLAKKYAITSLQEAQAYLADPRLGSRLRECTRIVNGLKHRTLEQVFGSTDALKFRSCMTLFALADPDEAEFEEALKLYCDGKKDPLTMDQLNR